MVASRAFATFTLLYHLFLLVSRACAEDVTTTIDDSDPGIQHIVGKWSQFTGSEYYKGTETLTREAGATILYTFSGTSIAVYGTQCDPGGALNTTVSTYTLDNFGPSTYTEPPGVKCNQNFVNFYTSPPLQNGQHTLIIKNVNAGAWFFVDFLKVTAPRTDASETPIAISPSSPSGTPTDSTSQTSASTSSVSTSSVSTSSVSTSSASGTTSSTSASPSSLSGTPADSTSQTSTPTSSTSTSPSIPSVTLADSTSRNSKSSAISTGAIAGIAVGLAALLALLIFAALLWKKRHREPRVGTSEEGFTPVENSSPPVDVTPYIVSDTTMQNSTRYGFDSKGVSGYSRNVGAGAANGSSSTTATSSVMSLLHTESITAEMPQMQAVVEPEDSSHRYSIASTIPPAYVR